MYICGAEARTALLQALERAEAKKWLPVDALFEDVYDKIPEHLQEQHEALVEHLTEFRDQYPILQKLDSP